VLHVRDVRAHFSDRPNAFLELCVDCTPASAALLDADLLDFLRCPVDLIRALPPTVTKVADHCLFVC
jgi:hypothetical protein